MWKKKRISASNRKGSTDLSEPRIRQFGYTLLELLVGMALLLLASGAIFWNMHGAIKKYRFSSDIAKVEMHLSLCHRLALNTGVDLILQIAEDKGRLILHPLSVQKTPFLPKPLTIDSLKAFFNNRELGQLAIYFSPTGYIAPLGLLEFQDSAASFHKEIDLAQLFRAEQVPDAKGPVHPKDF